MPNASFAAARCVSAANCVSAGLLTAHFDGRSQALGPPPAAFGSKAGGEVGGLSCPTTRECIGVGVVLPPISGNVPAAAHHAIADVITG